MTLFTLWDMVLSSLVVAPELVEPSPGTTTTPFDGNEPAGYSALGMEASIQSSSESAKVILGRVVSDTKREREKTACHFNDGSSVILANFIGALVGPGDEISSPVASDSGGGGGNRNLFPQDPVSRAES